MGVPFVSLIIIFNYKQVRMCKMDLLLILVVIYTILRAMIFYKREEKWWKSLIPGYNKYLLAKLCDCKKLGKYLAVISTLTSITFITKYAFELEITSAIYSFTGNSDNIYDIISKQILDINEVLFYVLIISGCIYLILWLFIMRRFSEKNNTSTWWVIGWLVPVIPYFYYALICKKFYIPEIGVIEIQEVRKKIEKDKKRC